MREFPHWLNVVIFIPMAFGCFWGFGYLVYSVATGILASVGYGA